MGTHPIFESDFDCLTECQVPLQLPTSENPPREVEPHQVALQPSEIANHNHLPKRPPLPPLPTRDPVTCGNFTPDSPGIKVGPVPVLVMSLMFIASVFILHIWGKYTRS